MRSFCPRALERRDVLSISDARDQNEDGELEISVEAEVVLRDGLVKWHATYVQENGQAFGKPRVYG